VAFDDGHASQYQHAVPLLRGSAMFFVTAGWMGSMPGHMSWDQVREIAGLGHEIQSHGWSHKLLTECSDTELKEELERSKATLIDRLGMQVEAISLPGGAWDARTFEACAKAGYRRVYISDPWFGEQERNGVLVIGRLMLRRTTTAGHLKRLLEAEGKPLSSVRFPYQLRQALRASLGDRLYHRLWCLAANDAMREELNRRYQQTSV
jgi:peptidoglycan/xylan/chitin deacetylase (PgdA/CDA1 family)